MSNELSCQEMIEVVTNYLDGAMPSDERQRFEHHLSYCAGCGTYVDQMRETISGLAELPQEKLSPQLQADLIEAFRDWKAGG